jgi:hypothetical protein
MLTIATRHAGVGTATHSVPNDAGPKVLRFRSPPPPVENQEA